MPLLSKDQLDELVRAATSAGLTNPERRPLLFRQIAKGISESLPVFSRPSDQLRSDLYELNDILESTNSEYPPLALWLDNAIELAFSRSESRVFGDIRNSFMTSQISVISQTSIEEYKELQSRRDLVEAALKLLQRPTKAYRASIIGPLFLHPDWYKERRNRKSQLPDYDSALGRHILKYGKERNHDIRLMLTFSDRYRAKISEYIQPNERQRFQEEMLKAVDDLWGENGDCGPDICCVHPGFIHIQMIFDSAVITTYRASQLTPTGGGLFSSSPDAIIRERAQFDTIFDTSSQGQSLELAKLHDKIKNIWR